MGVGVGIKRDGDSCIVTLFEWDCGVLGSIFEGLNCSEEREVWGGGGEGLCQGRTSSLLEIVGIEIRVGEGEGLSGQTI